MTFDVDDRNTGMVVPLPNDSECGISAPWCWNTLMILSSYDVDSKPVAPSELAKADTMGRPALSSGSDSMIL
ncbi:MAG: hypothetical protein ABI887_00775 [Burkholderiales bacterium]